LLRRKEIPNHSATINNRSYFDHDDASSKYSTEYIEEIPSSPTIVPETRIKPPGHVWMGFGNYGIPRTHSQRVNYPLPPMGRHNKVNAMSVEKPRVSMANYDNMESNDGERNGEEMEEEDDIPYDHVRYGQFGYKAVNSNDEDKVNVMSVENPRVTVTNYDNRESMSGFTVTYTNDGGRNGGELEEEVPDGRYNHYDNERYGQFGYKVVNSNNEEFEPDDRSYKYHDNARYEQLNKTVDSRPQSPEYPE
ncbi:3436_t:CDS:1, partial [Racocetra fulgida]